MEENKIEKKTSKRVYKKSDKNVSKKVESSLEAKKWVFKNVNRRVILSGSTITNEDLLKNQKLADILIEKGLGNLICLK